MDTFYTIKQPYQWEQTIEKSRFIGIACPIFKMADVEAKLKQVRETFPNARHYVYAYRIAEGNIEKSTDDGEPQGTGGRPVLEILQHKEVWNILLVIVRYFGGILLGTGGLTRAYGGTARNLIEMSSLIKQQDHLVYQLELDYPLFEIVKYQLNQQQWEMGSVGYTEKICAEVYIPLSEEMKFQQWLEGYITQPLRWELKGHSWRGEQG